ncbi:MAG TPA: hypothetical protein VMW65_16690, partial [Chloroflexota bacterium]|nr:hypothetical protein [Chloroflexota bacterium]
MSETPSNSGSAVSRLIALVGGFAATSVAIGLMFWVRTAYQIRTLPERVMEWLLLFVPTNLFEKGLQAFGANAKDIALYGAYVVMALILLALAMFVIRRSATTIVVASAGLWLFAMAVVMPVTGAGFFATGLFQDVLLTNLCYLGIAFDYAIILFLVRALVANGARSRGYDRRPASASIERRVFIGGVVGGGVTLALTLWAGRSAGAVSSDLPLATIPQALPTPPTSANPTVMSVATTSAVPPATAIPGTTPTAVAQVAVSPTAASAAATTPMSTSATPTAGAAQAAPTAPALTPIPVSTVGQKLVVPPPPPPARQIARDKDGSLTGAVPPPGQIAPLYTPNNVFYITTKNAGGDPVVNGT